jgi:hypothetical protein
MTLGSSQKPATAYTPTALAAPIAHRFHRIVIPANLCFLCYRQQYNPWMNAQLEPFHAIAISKLAHALKAQGRSIIHMEFGQPSTGAPKPAIAKAHAVLDAESMGYWESAPLKERLAQFYMERYGVTVAADQFVLTCGASPALVLALEFDVFAGRPHRHGAAGLRGLSQHAEGAAHGAGGNRLRRGGRLPADRRRAGCGGAGATGRHHRQPGQSDRHADQER